MVVDFPLTDENAQKQADDLGTLFTEKFLQDSENITLLLTLLEVPTLFRSISSFIPEVPQCLFFSALLYLVCFTGV